MENKVIRVQISQDVSIDFLCPSLVTRQFCRKRVEQDRWREERIAPSARHRCGRTVYGHWRGLADGQSTGRKLVAYMMGLVRQAYEKEMGNAEAEARKGAEDETR